jgi:hypothetical protein
MPKDKRNMWATIITFLVLASGVTHLVVTVLILTMQSVKEAGILSIQVLLDHCSILILSSQES